MMALFFQNHLNEVAGQQDMIYYMISILAMQLS